MAKAADTLVYRAPPKVDEAVIRRVYMLPIDLVKRIHEFGYANGHPSEVAAVRDLLERSLDLLESQR